MAESQKFITERIPYPDNPVLKSVFKSPILLWRLGLGALVGRGFMIMTTTGRKSGQPRRTAIEYHAYQGRKYVMVGWKDSDWYKNLLADPRLTIQTADGVERVRARLLTDAEYQTAWDFAESSPWMRMVMKVTGTRLTREAFIAQRDRFTLMTFDPTSEPTPPPLSADLVWVWGVLLGGVVIGWLLGRQAARP